MPQWLRLFILAIFYPPLSEITVPCHGSPEHVPRALRVLVTDVGVEPAVPVRLVRHQSLPPVGLRQLVEPNLNFNLHVIELET